MREHTLPGLRHDGQILLAIEQAVFDSPRDGIGKKSGAGDFGIGIRFRIEQACAPYAIRRLKVCDTLGHLLVLRYVLRSRWIVLRHALKDKGQAGKHPSVASRPEDLSAVGFAHGEEAI